MPSSPDVTTTSPSLHVGERRTRTRGAAPVRPRRPRRRRRRATARSARRPPALRSTISWTRAACGAGSSMTRPTTPARRDDGHVPGDAVARAAVDGDRAEPRRRVGGNDVGRERRAAASRRCSSSNSSSRSPRRRERRSSCSCTSSSASRRRQRVVLVAQAPAGRGSPFQTPPKPLTVHAVRALHLGEGAEHDALEQRRARSSSRPGSNTRTRCPSDDGDARGNECGEQGVGHGTTDQ